MLNREAAIQQIANPTHSSVKLHIGVRNVDFRDGFFGKGYVTSLRCMVFGAARWVFFPAQASLR